LKIFILTFCREIELLYGSTLIFKTLRTGFPTAEITVVDNASIPSARPVISRLAKQSGCAYVQLKTEIKHHHNMNTIVLGTKKYKEKGTVIFLDPDIVFFECCEDWDFGRYLFAGRLIPTYADEFTQSLMLSRIHLSFLWIPDIELLRNKINEHPKRHLGFDPFLQYTFFDTNSDGWFYLDTGAGLFLAFREEAYCFGEKELDAYSHIFCGSYGDVVAPCLNSEDRKTFLRHHMYAKKGDYEKLRGVWREQDDYFKRRSNKPESDRRGITRMQKALDEGNRVLDELEAESPPTRR